MPDEQIYNVWAIRTHKKMARKILKVKSEF